MTTNVLEGVGFVDAADACDVWLPFDIDVYGCCVIAGVAVTGGCVAGVTGV